LPDPHRWSTGLAAVAVSFAGIALTAHTGTAQPDPDTRGVGIQLLDAPVSRRDDPRALRYIVDHVPPGAVLKRNVLVVNKSSGRRVIEVYPGSATVEGERFRFGEGRTTSELTSWISVDRSRLDLKAGEAARLSVTIRVDPTASPGERYGVLWASTVPDPADQTPEANVTQVHRVGVRIYLDVGPGGEPVSEFAIGQLIPARDEQGNPSVAVHVVNTGERAVDLTGSATLSEGPGGVSAGPFEVVKGTTLGPGQAGTVTVWFPRELPNGPWTIRVALDSGKTTGKATAHITFPDPGKVGEAGSPLTSPWMLSAFALPVVAGLAFLIHRRSRRSVRIVRRRGVAIRLTE
jgi:hypothetical protein